MAHLNAARRAPLVFVMLAALLVALLPLVAQAGKTYLAHTTITLTTFEGEPVEGATLILKQREGDLRLEGKTDKAGRLVVDLPEGAFFAVTCIHEDKTYEFGDKEIPNVGGPLNFTLNLKIKSSAMATSTASMSVKRTETRTTVTVMNSMGAPEPDAVVRFVGVDTDLRFEGRTDSNGQWLLTLPRAKTFEISADKYGVTFELGPHQIPDVDSFILNLKLRLERSVMLAALAAASGADAGAGVAVNAGAAGAASGSGEAGAGAGGASAQATLEATQVVVTVLIFDQYKNPESEALITLTPASGEGKTFTGSTDSSGRFVLLLSAGQTYNMTVEKYGLTAEAGAYAIPEAESYEIAHEVTLGATFLETIRLENVYFDTAKATLRPESFAPLDELVELLRSHPTMIIELAGHTDNRGEDLYNLDLSRRRSNSVRDYLISKGIDAKRLAAKGYGEFEPVVANDTPEHLQLNRRTEMRIIQR